MKTTVFRTWPAGITLIELMIALAILAIVLAIAYPSYQRWVLQSHRNAVQTEMNEIGQNFERCRTRANAYNACGLVDAFDDEFSDSERYRFSVAADAGTYTIEAVPQSTGNQTADRCGTLTVNHRGVRGVKDANPGVTAADCW